MIVLICYVHLLCACSLMFVCYLLASVVYIGGKVTVFERDEYNKTLHTTKHLCAASDHPESTRMRPSTRHKTAQRCDVGDQTSRTT